MGSISDSVAFIEASVPYVENPPEGYVAGSMAQYRLPQKRPLRKVHDLRHYPDFDLDTNGFQLISLGTQPDQYSDVDFVKSVVYPQTAEAIRATTGASKVVCFSHLVRRQKLADVGIEDTLKPDDAQVDMSVPSPAAHIDFSAHGSLEVMHDNLPEAEAEAFEKSGRRWGVINLWRPLKPIKRDPLCVCDASSIEEGDLTITRIQLPKTSNFANVSRGSSFEGLFTHYNPNHEWYYVSDMQPHEALLLKIHDSLNPDSKITENLGRGEGQTVAGGVPHTALRIPGTEEMEARESFEVRCLVFWD